MRTMIRTGALALGALTLVACAHNEGVAQEVLPKPDSVGAYYAWTPEEQLIGYRNMEKIFPTRVIKRGGGIARLGSGDKLDMAYLDNHQFWTTEEFMDSTNATAVVVLHRGKVVLERYRAGRDENSRWTSFSVAKSLSSTLVGAALKDGAIKSLDDRITDYLPGLKGSAYEGVTVRHLLNMTSGVKWNEDYADTESDVQKIRAEKSIDGSDPIVTYMARLPREAEPGTKFVYKTGETHLVGSLVRAATKKPLADYLSEKIWSRIGMQRDAVWSLDPAGNEYAGCCVSATARDFARFGRFFMKGAKVDGESIVPDGWVQMATTSTEAAKRPSGSGYGFQWWTTATPAYQGRGIFGQRLYIDPERDVVIVIQSAWPAATHPGNNAKSQGFVDAVLREIDEQTEKSARR